MAFRNDSFLAIILVGKSIMLRGKFDVKINTPIEKVYVKRLQEN